VVRLNGKIVEFDIVKTTKLSLVEYYETVKAAVRNTPLRHLHRANDTDEAKEERRRIATAITEENHSRMEALRESKENADKRELGPTFTVLVSETGSLGEFFRSLWGAHVIYKVRFYIFVVLK
jgi:Na+-translocating ferredoxin:NAD+ oxidoreductase RnfC subunit